MSEPVLLRYPDGTLSLRRLHPWLVEVFRGLPHLLDLDPDDGVAGRLFPNPTADDAGANEDWRRLVVPELFALLASSREVVEKDLEQLARSTKLPISARLEIRPQHRAAWIHALHTARLHLGMRFEVEEEDLDPDGTPGVSTEREQAIACIQILGWLEEVLIQEEAPPAPRSVEEDSPEEADEGERS